MWLPDLMMNHIVSPHTISPIKRFLANRTVMWLPTLIMNHIVVHNAASESSVVHLPSPFLWKEFITKITFIPDFLML